MRQYLVLLFISITATIILANKASRSFEVDYENNQFLMNGEPFRYISGSFHYFRAFPETWRKKLRTMRAAGLNAVSTYVEWSLHNPKDGVYNWEGIANIVEFIQTAKEEDLYVILRTGPYICAERDFGGMPYWLLHKHPDIKIRTSDKQYLYEITTWYKQLMPRIQPLLFGNGGPIIMVQVENEYGFFFDTDVKYKEWLRDETKKYVKNAAVLFTTDSSLVLSPGGIKDVLATVDFGPALTLQGTAVNFQAFTGFFEYQTSSNASYHWKNLRAYQPQGPLVNSEFYTGWLTHWEEKFQSVKTDVILETLRTMLDDGASVNFFVFQGGTNFGFTSGASVAIPNKFSPVITSYDYDAPLDESGDVTNKYFEIRNLIGKYLPLPDIPIPKKTLKLILGKIHLNPIDTILSKNGRKYLGSRKIYSNKTLSFEYLNQYSGLVLYETTIKKFNGSMVLTVDKLRDRALVYIDNTFIGVLSRRHEINSLSIDLKNQEKLQILVENQGRINMIIPNDFKGILGDVRLNKNVLNNWCITGFPLDNYKHIENFIKNSKNDSNVEYLKNGPTIFYGEFQINYKKKYDTYLDTTGWGKGVAFVNGFNLGRYWPSVGPQITLYVPKQILLRGTNKVVLLEYHQASNLSSIKFTDIANLNG